MTSKSWEVERLGAPRNFYLSFLMILLTVGALVSIAPCEAGSISISTQASGRMDDGRLVGILKITNRGEDQAYKVRADAEVLGERFGTAVQPILEKGESKAFQFNLAVQSSKKGSYPMTVLVHFQDGNGYPFTALTCTTFFLGERVDADLSSTAVPLTIKDQGLLRFKIQNRGHRKNVRFSLHLPQEFASESMILDSPLMSGERKELLFPIRNLSALYGATYPVFLAQEYDEEGMHFAMITSAMVSILREGNWFRRTRWYWAGGMVLLIGFIALRGTMSKITRNLLTL